MSYAIQRNHERGHLDHGWLKTAHSFSFAHYVNRERQNFGALLVMNEDTIAPNQGFGKHFHDNMEIITIPLSGALRHEDSLGNGSTIQAGMVQIMSAGTGIMHSEENPSPDEPVHLLQIWIIPAKRDLPTRYEEKKFDEASFHNILFPLVTPEASPDGLQIFQDAWIHLGRFDAGMPFTYSLKNPAHGLFLFVIAGEITLEGQTLQAGDTVTFWDQPISSGKTLASSFLLAIEVPLSI